MIIDPTHPSPRTVLLDPDGHVLAGRHAGPYRIRRLDDDEVDVLAEVKPCVPAPCPPPEYREVTVTFCQDPVVDLFHRIAARRS